MVLELALESSNACRLQDRRSSSIEFNSFGAATLNVRLPIEDRMSGTERRLVPDERRLR